jgi:hypothetical protein
VDIIRFQSELVVLVRDFCRFEPYFDQGFCHALFPLVFDMATLPAFLFDTHKRYKADTNRVVTWLAETAQKCGLTLNTQPSSSRPSGRLKGKARKEARAAGTCDAKLSQIVTVKQFLDMAKLIATQKPPVAVPDLILRLLRSAIDLRRRCSNWFQKNGNQQDGLRKSTATHSHFIDVLEDVLRILDPNSSRSADTRAIGDAMEKLSVELTASDTKQPNNPFDVLFIEDDLIDEPVLASEPSTQLSQASPSRLKVRFEVEATDDEIYFAIYCFFNDLNRLRDFVRDLWCQYQTGSSDLITASVTTNAALELVGRAESDLAVSFPECDSFKATGLLLYVVIMDILGKEDTTTKGFGYDVPELAEWLFLPVYTQLEVIVDALPAKGVYTQDPNLVNESQLLADRNKLTSHDRCKLDHSNLLDAISGYYLFSRFDTPPVADEFSECFRSFVAKRKVSISTTFAAQIFLDIRQLLREDINRGFTELQVSATQAASSLTDFVSTTENLSTPPSLYEKKLHAIREFIDFWITNDPVAERLASHPVLSGIQEHFFLRRNPLFCGLFQFKIYLLLQEAGIELSVGWGSIVSVAHLYEACLQGGYVTGIWADMEILMEVHTRDRIFAGRVPNTPEDAFKSLSLMTGASPVMFAKNIRSPRNTTKRSKNRYQRVDLNSPITSMLRQHFYGNGHTQLTAEIVEGLLLDNRAGASKTVGVRSRDQGLVRKQWAKTHNLSIMQLLEAMRDATAVEQCSLRLDYFSLHQRCRRLLKTLVSVLGDNLRQFFNLDQDTLRPAVVVPHILRAVAMELSGAESWRDGNESLVMKQAGAIIEEFIKRKGSEECKKLQKMNIRCQSSHAIADSST